MKQLRFLIIFVSLMASFTASAAIEYFRLTGNISNLLCNGCTDLGVAQGQFVYFDFIVDTEFQSLYFDDTDYQDFFEAVPLASTAINGLDFSLNNFSGVAGVTTTYPEGRVTEIVGFSDTLSLGTDFFSLPLDGNGHYDFSIDAWTANTPLYLFYDDFTDPGAGSTQLANLQLNYRGSTPPPAIVPIPMTAWLLLSAIGSLAIFRQRH